MIHKILLAVDGSPNAQRAAKYVATYMADCPETEISIISVAPEFLAEQDKNNTNDQSVKIADQAAKMAAAILKPVNPKVQSIIKKGTVSKEIVDCANEGNYHLIVMGSRGLTNFEGIALGSSSQAVLTLTQLPVMFIK
ncbi:universal stress protein [Peptococcaceae bacterium]|nr:universal stress protein [Peptococcaceae bacterium]